MKRHLLLALFASLTLSACSSTSDPELEKKKFLKAKEDAVNVTFTNRAVAQSVVGFRAVAVNLVSGAEQFQGSASSTSGGTGQVSDAKCDIKGDGYSASFDAPAIVNMPSFGEQTKPVTLSCTYGEDKKISQTIRPVNLSQTSRTSGAVAVGVLLCPVCGVAMAAGGAGDKSGDAYGFDSMTLRVN